MRSRPYIIFSLLSLAIGCSGKDVCSSYNDQTCIALLVKAPVMTALSIDQLRVSMGSSMAYQSSNSSGQVLLPVTLALLPNAALVGQIDLTVSGMLSGNVVGEASIQVDIQQKRHVRAEATLQLPGTNDLSTTDSALSDLSGADSAATDATVGVDASVADLTPPHFPFTRRDVNDYYWCFDVWATTNTNAIATCAFLYRTINGGSSWAPLSFAGQSDDYKNIWGSGNHLFAIGNSGHIAHSSNGGSDFEVQASGVAENLGDVSGVNENLVYIVGAKGTLLKSTTQGASWESISTGITENFYTLWVAPDGTLFAGGPSGLYVSNTGGTSWVSTPTPAQSIESVWGVSSSEVYAVGGGNLLFYRNGNNWASRTLPAADFFRVWGSGVDLIAVGQHSVVIYSTDHGLNWKPNSFPVADLSLLGIHGTGVDDFFIVGESGIAAHYP